MALTFQEIQDARNAWEWLRRGDARHIREEAGLSRRDIAEAVGVTPGAVVMWETYGQRPRLRTAVRLGQLLRELAVTPRDINGAGR